MSPCTPKPIREFLKDVKRASIKEKKSVIMSMKKARDMAEALEGTFDNHHLSES